MIKKGQVKILVADDDSELREMVAERFRIFGFNVIEVSDGQEALDCCLSQGDIKIAVIDIFMPHKTGLEFFKDLSQAQLENPPRVFLMSGKTEYSLEELFHLGVEGFISKPFETKDLIRAVRKGILPLSERWKYPPSQIPKPKLSLNLLSLTGSQENFWLGHGGFSAISQEELPEPGHQILFELQLPGKKIEGCALLQWKKESPLKKSHFIYGFEFTFIKGQGLTDVISAISEVHSLAFIPKAA